jgi:HEAT repeat protein
LFTSFQLKSRDAATRRRAALSLGVAGKNAAIATLEPLTQDPEWTVREGAAEALGAIASPETVMPLARLIQGADQIRESAGAAAVRAAAIRALGRTGPGAVTALVTLLTDRHAKVREGAIDALGAIGGVAAATALVSALEDDRSSVRQAAAAALARAGRVEAVPGLRSALAHKDPTTRRGAAESLGAIRDAAAVDALRAALGDRDRSVREVAVQGLARIASPEAVAALLAALPAGDRDQKAAVTTALKSFDWSPADASERIVHAVLHGRFDEAAAEGSAAVDALVAALSDRDAAHRRGALVALTALHDERAAASVAALLRDPEAAVRDAAVECLAATGPDAAGVLVEGLRDRAAQVRSACRQAIARIGEEALAGALLRRLSVGRLTRHGSTELRVVATRAELDGVRLAADGLHTLLTAVAKKLPTGTLTALGGIADVLLLEPGQVPSSSERVDNEELRQTALAELRVRSA